MLYTTLQMAKLSVSRPLPTHLKEGQRVNLSAMLILRISSYDSPYGIVWRYEWEGSDGCTHFVYNGRNLGLPSNVKYIDCTATIKKLDTAFGVVRLAWVKVTRRLTETEPRLM